MYVSEVAQIKLGGSKMDYEGILLGEDYTDILIKEGNRKTFIYKGFNCLILRPMPESGGFLCGYVEIEQNHELYNNQKCYDLDYDVHGGITYKDFMKKEDNKYLIGFDCAHYNDYMPTMPYGSDGIYRTMEYVESELKQLVDQFNPHT